MKSIYNSLEVKFISLALVIVLIFSAVINYFVFDYTRISIHSEAIRRARLLAESSAISFTNTLLYEEIGLVEEGGLLENQILELIDNKDTDLMDMAVFDPEGHPIATNDFYWYQNSHIFADHSYLIHAKEMLVNEVVHDKRKAFEVVTPLNIHGKRFGSLAMYFSRDKEYLQLATLRNQLMLFTIIGFASSMLLAFIIARILATPIKNLDREMVLVSNPFYRPGFKTTRRDEIGQLEKGFSGMMARLREGAIEQEKSQQALIQAEKMAAFGTLVAGLAHEINNPLAGVKNCLRRIKSKPENIAQTRKYANLMSDALSRIEKLVHSLLHFSRKKETLFSLIEINSVISQAIEFLSYRLNKRSILLKKNLGKNLPPISGNIENLEQVFINLILNSLDAMPGGGELSITTSSSDGTIYVEIIDTGQGIYDKHQDSIFDPFFTTKEIGKGTGLGLAVCKQIVVEHMGTISMTSKRGEGTTFHLRFPICMENSFEKDNLCVAILAGGESIRMGKNKALIHLNNKVLIQYAVDLAKTSSDVPLIITNSPEDFEFLHLPMQKDIFKNSGPLGGIYTALNHCQTEHCLILACDLPFLSKELLAFLRKHGTAYDVFAFDTGKGVEPLCAVYSKKCIPVMKEQLDRGNLRVTDIYSHVRTKTFFLEESHRLHEPSQFFNINTPEDFQESDKIAKERAAV